MLTEENNSTYCLSKFEVQCTFDYNMANFFPNTQNRCPIACRLGWDVGCLLWVQSLIYVLPQILQCCMHYINSLVQNCSKSSALALELLWSCTKQSMSCYLGSCNNGTWLKLEWILGQKAVTIVITFDSQTPDLISAGMITSWEFLIDYITIFSTQFITPYCGLWLLMHA